MPRVEWVVIGQPNGSEKGANIIVVGCDYHPSFQQIAHVDTETGEWKEQRLEHRESAEAFYRELASRGAKLRVGMEASGHARWFERLLAELGIELWLGDAAGRTRLSQQLNRHSKSPRGGFSRLS